VSKPNAFGLPNTEANQSPPIALTEPQMPAFMVRDDLFSEPRVAGSLSPEQDEECARAGIATLQFPRID
jgi:hypothetical protein